MKITNDATGPRAHRRGLPGLRALRVFEAVAYHGSLTRAADELAVSQGAVSHQIRQIEDSLGTRLFHRGGRGVTLTPQGVLLRDTVQRALDEIGEVLSVIRAERRAKVLRVRAGPFFSMKVIAPRMADFMRRNPGVQLHLNNLRDHAQRPGPNDVFIEYGPTPPAGTHAIEIMQEALVPVASPALLDGAGDAAALLARADVPRLNYRDLEEWARWLAMAGMRDDGAHPNLIFDDQHTNIEAARAGLGIALADRALVALDVGRGRLVVLSDRGIHPPARYWMICADAGAGPDRLAVRFGDWLVAQIRQMQATDLSAGPSVKPSANPSVKPPGNPTGAA